MISSVWIKGERTRPTCLCLLVSGRVTEATGSPKSSWSSVKVTWVRQIDQTVDSVQRPLGLGYIMYKLATLSRGGEPAS